MLIHQPIDYHAERRPKGLALTAADYEWDYATLVAKSHNVAATLIEMGVTPGNRVGVLGLNSATHFAVILGASRVGAVTVSVNFRLAPAELAFILDDAKAEVLFVTDNTIDEAIDQTLKQRDMPTRLVANRQEAHLQLTSLLSRDGAPVRCEQLFNEHAPVLQLYTSGTTGKPKGAVLSHRNIHLAYQHDGACQRWALLQQHRKSCGCATFPYWRRGGDLYWFGSWWALPYTPKF